MILLADDNRDSRMTELKNSLSSMGIPCVTVGVDRIIRYPEAFAVFVFTKSHSHLNIVSLRCRRIPLLAVNESGSRIYNNDVHFYDPAAFASYEEFICSFLKERYGLTVGEYTCGDLRISKCRVTYGINTLKLTPTEQRILCMLAFCKGRWISEKNIGEVCFDTGSNSCRVSVHVCNINNKAKRIAGRKLILCKRGEGYMLYPGI